jgi:hypothetical protein
VIDLLQDLLTLRINLYTLRQKAEGYGLTPENAPEFAELQRLERSVFAKVQEWEKPDE